MAKINNIIVVGAGPVGLLLSLLLAQHGISVQVLEAQAGVDQRPRGLAYGPSAIRTIRRAGVLDEARGKTWDLRTMSWRNLKGDLLAEMVNLDDTNDPDRILLWPVHLLSNLLLEKVSKHACAEVLMSHPVTAVGQDESQAWVDVQLDEGSKRLYADYVVGCDGGKSAVRRSLYGENNFPGYTWKQQLVVTNASHRIHRPWQQLTLPQVYYDIHKHNWSDLQWVIDPEIWGLICCISKEEKLWRVGYGVEGGQTDEQLRASLPEVFAKLLPGCPGPDDYEVVRFSPFSVHQRCVDNMTVGRCVLAGDAAHLCNPMGGLGLTGGISDIGSLVDCFYGIHDGKAGPEILDKYDEIRVSIYKTVIDPVSKTNLERLWKDPEKIKDIDPFFALVRKAGSDPKVAEDLKMMHIGHDMTQYYDQSADNGSKDDASHGDMPKVNLIENAAMLA